MILQHLEALGIVSGDDHSKSKVEKITERVLAAYGVWFPPRPLSPGACAPQIFSLPLCSLPLNVQTR